MRIALLAVLLSATVASAAEPHSYDLKKLEKIGGASFRPTDKQYPGELSAAGVQGEVLVIVPLTEDGMPDGTLLGATSRSEQLDKIALDLVKAAKFQVKEAPAKGWKAVVVPVGFFKDSVATLKTKTCADFNVDFSYQLKTFPEQKPEQMRLFEMLTGILYFGAGGKPAQAAEVAKRAKAARQPTIDGCKANPDDLLLETWQKSVKAASVS
jgi:TonB family protein